MLFQMNVIAGMLALSKISYSQRQSHTSNNSLLTQSDRKGIDESE